MKANKRLLLCAVALFLTALFLGVEGRLRAQGHASNNGQDSVQTAEQKFKNIRVLKEIPADQLIPSMQFITASLGVECEFCHVAHEMDKDDKKTKLTARKMMTMMMAINKANFDGEREVTCYTCHRGSAHPVGDSGTLGRQCASARSSRGRRNCCGQVACSTKNARELSRSGGWRGRIT